jgi:hypothetical protein
VIVVTDRRILDDQIQKTIKQDWLARMGEGRADPGQPL